MTLSYPAIPWDMDDLYAEDGRIDALKKGSTVNFDKQATAADKKIWADLANRQRPIYPGNVLDHAQLTPLKTYWMMHLIYQGGITSGSGPERDRNAYLAGDFEERYNRELARIHITTPEGARVKAQNKVVRC